MKNLLTVLTLALPVNAAFAGIPNSISGDPAKVLYHSLTLPAVPAPEQGGIGTMQVKAGDGFSCQESGIFPGSYDCDFPLAAFHVDTAHGYVYIQDSAEGGVRVAKSLFESLPEAGMVETDKTGMIFYDKRAGKILSTKAVALKQNFDGTYGPEIVHTHYSLRLDF